MGWLGKLYEIVASYTHNPIGEIEMVAQQALEIGIIDDKRYTILRYRIPFLGNDRKTLEEIGDGLSLSRQGIEDLEFQIYMNLSKYAFRKKWLSQYMVNGKS